MISDLLLEGVQAIDRCLRDPEVCWVYDEDSEIRSHIEAVRNQMVAVFRELLEYQRRMELAA